MVRGSRYRRRWTSIEEVVGSMAWTMEEGARRQGSRDSELGGSQGRRELKLLKQAFLFLLPMVWTK